MFREPALIKLEYKKIHRSRIRSFKISNLVLIGACLPNTNLHVSVDCLVPRLLTSKHIATLRRSLMKVASRDIYFLYRAFPTVMITAKPREMRMGKGKGGFSSWVLQSCCGLRLFYIFLSPTTVSCVRYLGLMKLRYRVFTGIYLNILRQT